jgi:hypothetical protein
MKLFYFSSSVYEYSSTSLAGQTSNSHFDHVAWIRNYNPPLHAYTIHVPDNWEAVHTRTEMIMQELPPMYHTMHNEIFNNEKQTKAPACAVCQD